MSKLKLKDVVFCPTIRVGFTVSCNETEEETAIRYAINQLGVMSKGEILQWLENSIETICDAE